VRLDWFWGALIGIALAGVSVALALLGIVFALGAQ
jgi:hypothetical protein